MSRADDDAEVLRMLSQQLGLRSTPTPDEFGPTNQVVDDAWAQATLEKVISQARAEEDGSPVRVVEALDARRRSPAGDIGPSQRSPHVSAGSGRPRRRAGWFAAAAAVILVMVVGGPLVLRPQQAYATPPVLSFSEIDPAELSPTSGQGAREELLAVAQAAGRQPERARDAQATVQQVSTDQWRLEVTHGAQGSVALVVRPTHNDSWLSMNGALRLREVATASQFSPTGELLESSEPGQVVRDETVPAGTRGALWVSSLPRDPGELVDELVAASQDPRVADPTPTTTVLLSEVSEIFARWVVPADLRETFWRALAEQPDMRFLGTVADRAGRLGEGFAHWDAQAQTLEVLIIEPGTGQLLGTESVLFGYPGAKATAQFEAPVVGAFTTYLSAEWVPGS